MIRVEHLRKRYGRVTAVDDLSFEVARGEAFALLGPNGCGKSTTLKCLVGLVMPSSGGMTIGGFDLTTEPLQARRAVSYLPQRVAFPATRTPREVLAFYARLRGAPAARVEQLLAGDRFGFNGCGDRPAGELSGGMVQRLGLAVACLADAEVLVLDEPTVGLDPESAARLRDLLAAQKHEGKTIVFSSHVLSDVERLADRIAVLDAGRLVALETAAGLGERRARSGRLRVSLGSVSRAVVDAARRAGADDAALDGRDLVVVCRPDRRVDVLGAVAAAGGPITGFETREPTLEDLYLRGWNA